MLIKPQSISQWFIVLHLNDINKNSCQDSKQPALTPCHLPQCQPKQEFAKVISVDDDDDDDEEEDDEDETNLSRQTGRRLWALALVF